MIQGLNRDICLKIVGITKHQFYYQATGGKPGRATSMQTKWRDPATLRVYWVDNEDLMSVVAEYKLQDDEVNWYRLICRSMQIRGYYINHKKLYRLMQAYDLLELRSAPEKVRNYVKFRRVAPTRPLEVLEMDIKYIWVAGKERFAYLLTILDTFTRFALGWMVGFTMNNEQVRSLWELLIINYLQPADLLNKGLCLEVRNDNGPQFKASKVIDFFKANYMNQVFCHPYTPEENGHIESFHDTVGKALQKDRLADLVAVQSRFGKFFRCYNNNRSHSAILGISPAKFWALYDLGKIEVIPLGKRRIKYNLLVDYQDILLQPGIGRYDIG